MTDTPTAPSAADAGDPRDGAAVDQHGGWGRRGIALLGGLLAAALALGVAELLAGLNAQWRSPVLDVGDRVIDNVPTSVKDLAIDWFGTNDKLALLVGIGTFLGIYALVIGYIALGPVRDRAASTRFASTSALGKVRDALERAWRWLAAHRLAVGLVGIALFGLIGAWASSSRRTATPWHVVVPSVLGAAAGVGALWLLHQTLRPSPSSAASDHDGAASEHGNRRQFLGSTAGVLAGLTVFSAAAGALGRKLSGRFSAAESRADVALPAPTEALEALPPTVEVGVDGMTPFVTPNESFYRIDTALTAPQVPTGSYTLRVHGLVDNEIEISYEDLLARPMIERDITMTCVSNEIGGSLVGNARWLGTRLDDLLREAGVQAGADQVVGRSFDGFECGFPVANAMDGRDALVVVGMNGEPLPIEHGFPVRLVVPGLYGYVSATKWLTEIELTTFAEFDHYWLRRGWAQEAPIKLMSRIDTPRGLGKAPAGMVAIAGVAWEQTVGIEAVDVQIDDGEWQPAELATTPSNDTWVQWKLAWDAPAGRHSLRVRATDKAGAIQTDQRAEPIPDGASGLHQIVVIVE